MQVLVLPAIQVYLYTSIGIFLPALWFVPSDVHLVGRLEKLGWFYHHHPNPAYNILSLVNNTLVMPAFWLEQLWHAVISWEMKELIARRRPAERLHRGLRTAFLITVMIVCLKWVVETGAIFYPSWVKGQYISSVTMHTMLFFFNAYMYGRVLSSLRLPGPKKSRVFRSIRDRLLTLCTFLLIQLSARVTLIGLGLSGHPVPLPLQVFSNSVLLLRGFIDSMILGNICQDLSWYCCCYQAGKPSEALRRQTSDNRIRVGQSSVSTSRSKRGDLPSLRPDLHETSTADIILYPLDEMEEAAYYLDAHILIEMGQIREERVEELKHSEEELINDDSDRTQQLIEPLTTRREGDR